MEEKNSIWLGPLADRPFAAPAEEIPTPQPTSPAESAVWVIGTGKAMPDLLVLCDYPFQQALGGKYGA